MAGFGWLSLLRQLSVVGLVLMVLTACGGHAERDRAAAAADSGDARQAQVALMDGGGDAARGQALYATNCAACHGATGEGVQGLGKDMADSPFMEGLSDLELVEFLKVGRAPTDPLNTTGVLMPARGGNPTLTDAQLLDLVAFLRTLHS